VTPFKFGAARGAALFSADGLVAVRPADGSVLFRFSWKTSYQINAADPIFADGTVFVSSGYGRGCALLDFTSGQPKTVWENKRLRAHCNGPVLYRGHLYGGDGNINSRQGRFVCLDLKTGRKKWARPGMNGQCIVAGGRLIVTTTRGELVVAEADPARYRELARIAEPGGTCWTVPVLARGRIYVRNAKGHLVCLDARRP